MKTRDKLIEVAFDEIYKNGYSATSVDTILSIAGVHKGSLYNCFKSKKELTLAMIVEKLPVYINNKYGPLLDCKKDIVNSLLKVINNRNKLDAIYGCRLNNLIQELSPLDKEFKTELEKVYSEFENIIKKVLDNAIQAGEIKHYDTNALALYIVASFEGCLITAKKSQDIEKFKTCISQLEYYLNLLKVHK